MFNNRKNINFALFVFTCLIFSFTQTCLFAQTLPQFGDLEPGPYAVGRQIVQTFDYSRTFNTPKFDYKGEFKEGERSRPLTIVIWYPAEKLDSNEQMIYKEYFYPPVAEGEELTEEQKTQAIQQIRNASAEDVEEEKFNEIMMMPTAVVKNAKAAGGSFPLIVFAQGIGRGTGSQSILCEYLASHGYIVASSRSQGQRGPMTNDLLGVNAQIGDMEFIIGYLHDYPNLDLDKLGLAGYDFGGLAGALLMMKNSDVDALLSLDSALGRGASFGGNSATLFQSPYYNAADVRAAVMHLWTDPARGAFSPNFLQSLEYTNTYVIKLENLRHFDFSSFGRMSAMVPGFASRFAGEIKGDVNLGQTVIGKYGLHFFDAYVKQDEKALAFLRNKPEDNNFPADFVTAEINESPNPPPSERDITDMIMDGKAAGVAEIYRQFQKSDPDLELFSENALNNLGYQLLGQQNVDAAIEVFKLNVEAYPDSWNCYDSLGEGYAVRGETELAIKNYSIALEMNPDDERIIGVLDGLKNPQEEGN